MQKIVRKPLAILASFAMAASIVTAPLQEIGQPLFGGLTVSAANSADTANGIVNAATKMTLVDMDTGADLTDNLVPIYLDNSDIRKGPTKKTIRVTITNDSAGWTGDKIEWAREIKNKPNIGLRSNPTVTYVFTDGHEAKSDLDMTNYAEAHPNVHVAKEYMDVTIYSRSEDVNTGKLSSLPTGTTYLDFQTKSGKLYRRLNVVVYNTAISGSIGYVHDGDKVNTSNINFQKSFLLDNVYRAALESKGCKITALGEILYPSTDVASNIWNSDGYVRSGYKALGTDDDIAKVSVIANHKYQLSGKLTGAASGACTDEIEWRIIDGEYYKGIFDNAAHSNVLAEITQNGLLTPKKEGVVTIAIAPKTPEGLKKQEGMKDYVEYINSEGKVRLPIWKNDPNSLTGYSYSSQEIDCTEHAFPKYLEVHIVRENPAKSIVFEQNKDDKTKPLVIEPGESTQIDYSAEPTYTGKDYTGVTDIFRWVSDNPKVATVDSNGNVTGVSKGAATITVYGEKENVQASINVIVTPKASSIKLDPSPASTRVGVSQKITATLSPADAEDQIIWEAEDPSIVQVSNATNDALNSNVQSALITGLKEGVTNVIARTKYSGVEAKVQVTVNPARITNNITLTYTENGATREISDGSTVDLFTFQNLDITAALYDSQGNNSDDGVNWKVEGNDDYIEFDNPNPKLLHVHGLASKGREPVTVTITASSAANNNTKKTFKVNVLRSADKISIKDSDDKTSRNINVGASVQLTPTLSINDTSQANEHLDSVAKWETADSNVAIVDANGIVTVTGTGKTTIRCTSVSGSKVEKPASGQQYAEYTVTGFITSSVSESNLSKSKTGAIEMVLGTNGTVNQKLSPIVYDQNNKTVSGSKVVYNSDSDIITVDENGTVTATDVGMANITISSGSKYKIVPINVTAKGASSNMTAEAVTYDPNKTQYTTSVEIKIGNKVLNEGEDYDLTYSNNTQDYVGKSAKVKATFKGSYSGEKEVSFKINKKNINDTDVVLSPIPTQSLNGKEKILPTINLTYAGKTLVKDTDYTLSATNNNVVGDATLTIKGKGNLFEGTKIATFKIVCAHKNSKFVETIIQTTDIQDGLEKWHCDDCGRDFEKPIKAGTTTTSGDANDDGEINIKDVIRIQKFLNEDPVTINKGASDLNGDGEINVKDVIRLQKMINE